MNRKQSRMEKKVSKFYSYTSFFWRLKTHMKRKWSAKLHSEGNICLFFLWVINKKKWYIFPSECKLMPFYTLTPLLCTNPSNMFMCSIKSSYLQQHWYKLCFNQRVKSLHTQEENKDLHINSTSIYNLNSHFLGWSLSKQINIRRKAFGTGTNWKS